MSVRPMPNPKKPPFSRNAVALPVGGSENPNSNDGLEVARMANLRMVRI